MMNTAMMIRTFKISQSHNTVGRSNINTPPSIITSLFRPTTPSFRRNFTNDAPVNSEIMSLGKLNHVAIAVPDLTAATNLYRNILGAACSSSMDLPEHGVSTVFVNLGNTKLELLGQLGENSPIANFLVKNPKGGIHHICIEVKDINQALDHLQKSEIVVLDKKPKIGAHGKPVIFVHPKSMNGVLLELEQE